MSIPICPTLTNLQSVADVREVAEGQKGSCTECAKLRIEVDALKREIG